MKLLTNILVLLSIGLSAQAYDDRTFLADCSNDDYHVLVLQIDQYLSSVRIGYGERNEMVAGGYATYTLNEDTFRVLNFTSTEKAHGTTAVLSGVVEYCGTWCEDKGYFQYLDVLADTIVELPALSCKKLL